MKTLQISTAKLIAAFANAIAQGWVWRADRVTNNPHEIKKDSGIGVYTSPNVTCEVDAKKFHSQVGYNAHYVSMPIHDAENRVIGARGLNFFNPPDFVELLGGHVYMWLPEEGEEENDGRPMAVALSDDWATLTLTEVVEN